MSERSRLDEQRVKTLGPSVVEPVTKAWRERSDVQCRTSTREPSTLNAYLQHACTSNAEYAMQQALEFIPVPMILERLVPLPTAVPINTGGGGGVVTGVPSSVTQRTQ